MDKGTRKKNRVFSRRDFLKGVGGGAIGAGVGSTLWGAAAAAQAGNESMAVLTKKTVRFTLNGKSVTLDVAPEETLLHVLRERFGLTGAKRICDRGECGGCTVLLDGRPVYACLSLAIRADGRSVLTIEGLAGKEGLHPVQQAFINNDAYQCGFCTPGFILSSVALLNQNASPSADQIRSGLAGNICRCGNYQKIHKAVAEAATKMRKS